MNIAILAADLASRVPAMALDSPANNQALITGLIMDWLKGDPTTEGAELSCTCTSARTDEHCPLHGKPTPADLGM
jgi:hypothetical protein